MEQREKTKYVLGLPGGTHIGLEHGKNNLRTMTTNPWTPPHFERNFKKKEKDAKL